MTIDTSTLTAIVSTALLLIGGMVTAAIRWARAKAAIANAAAAAEARAALEESEGRARAAQDAAASTTKAVRELLTDILGPAQDDADGSGRWRQDRANGNTSAAACTSIDCRTDVLDAVKRLEGKVDKLSEKWETMFNVQRERVEKHRVRIALLESRVGVRRPSIEVDSERPTGR